VAGGDVGQERRDVVDLLADGGFGAWAAAWCAVPQDVDPRAGLGTDAGVNVGQAGGDPVAEDVGSVVIEQTKVGGELHGPGDVVVGGGSGEAGDGARFDQLVAAVHLGEQAHGPAHPVPHPIRPAAHVGLSVQFVAQVAGDRRVDRLAGVDPGAGHVPGRVADP
jgi:hypothetical protein